MVRSTINKLVKGSSRKFKVSSFERRMMIIENVMNEQTSKEYNPRRARSKSLKGIFFWPCSIVIDSEVEGSQCRCMH